MAREIHFVIAVDIDNGTISIDDGSYQARWAGNEQVWDTDKQDWRELKDNEYEIALELLNTRKLENESVIDPCVYCGNSTAFGSGRFVNRLPVDDGWGCAECSGFACDKCDKQIYLDEDVPDSEGNGFYHQACLETLDKK
jgi:hypothetical protein